MYTKQQLHQFVCDLDDISEEYAWSCCDRDDDREETERHLKSLEEVTATLS